MNRKETEQAIAAEIARHASITYRFERRGKHPSVVLGHAGRERFVTYSGTPTERRAVLNKITDIRRTIRELETA